MNVIQELIATGKARGEDFEVFYVGVFDRIRGELADESSELSRKFAAAQRRQHLAWSEMSQQVLGAERPARDYSLAQVVYG